MKLKRICLLLLVMLFVVCSFGYVNASAEGENLDISKFEFPKPQAPYYMLYDAADRTATEGSDSLNIISVADRSVLELATEYESDSDAFCEKYGLYMFGIYIQYDSSLDGTDNWNYTPEWDTYYGATGTENAAATIGVRSGLFDTVSLFDLYSKTTYEENYDNIAEAIIRRDVPYDDFTFVNYYFDKDNHNLHIRRRYYMEWQTYDGTTVGDTQSKFSEWSDVAVFGKDSTAIVPETPTKYEAPVISDLKYVPPTEYSELGSLSYTLNTPDSVWDAGIYYKMTEDGWFEGLETQISVDNSDWLPYNTLDGSGDWGLYNGTRTAYAEEPVLEANSYIKLRTRYVGAHGPSEWSNVIEINGGGTQEISEDSYSSVSEEVVSEETSELPVDEPKETACSICGFCAVPLGLCIFIWLAIIVAVIVIIVIIIMATKPKKCKKCGAKLEKGDTCPKCGNIN